MATMNMDNGAVHDAMKRIKKELTKNEKFLRALQAAASSSLINASTFYQSMEPFIHMVNNVGSQFRNIYNSVDLSQYELLVQGVDYMNKYLLYAFPDYLEAEGHMVLDDNDYSTEYLKSDELISFVENEIEIIEADKPANWEDRIFKLITLLLSVISVIVAIRGNQPDPSSARIANAAEINIEIQERIAASQERQADAIDRQADAAEQQVEIARALLEAIRLNKELDRMNSSADDPEDDLPEYKSFSIDN